MRLVIELSGWEGIGRRKRTSHLPGGANVRKDNGRVVRAGTWLVEPRFVTTPGIVPCFPDLVKTQSESIMERGQVCVHSLGVLDGLCAQESPLWSAFAGSPAPLALPARASVAGGARGSLHPYA